jgi:hypothetical protein
LTAVLQRGAIIGAAPANAVLTRPSILIPVNNGEVVNATIRYYAANVEQGIGNARPLLQRNVPEVIANIGDYDAEAVLAHVGSGDGFETTRYDQSGNGRNAAQTTAAAQPRIVSNGAIVTENGRPVVSFDGNDLLLTPSFILGNTVVTVARRSSRFQPVVEGANVSSTDRGLWGLRSGSSDFTTHLNYGVNGGPLNAANADGFPIDALQIVSQTVAKGTVATTPSIWAIGHGGGGYVPLIGVIPELISFPDVLSTTDRETLVRNQGAYYGISLLALDQIGIPAAAAYSLRKLRAAYTGNAIRVRRSSDNAEANIGFTAIGDLDTASLLAHVGSGDGFVVTRYDQSGNGRDATQTTPEGQLRIVSNGVLLTENGRATVAQATGSESLPISATFAGLTSATGAFVFRQLTDNAGAHDFRAQAGGVNNHSPWTTGDAYDSFFSASRQIFNGYGPSATPSTTTLTIHTARQTGTALQLFKNGTQIDGDKTVSFQLPDQRSLLSPSSFGTVALSGGVIFGALPIAERQLIERNRGAYYGIPIV